MATYDLARYDAIKDAVTKLSAEVDHMPDDARAKILAAANAAQAFTYSDYVDFGDFIKQISSQQIREIDTKVLDQANAALAQFVVVSKNTGTYGAATGASIWIPKDASTLGQYLATYKTLQWDTDTHWSTALSDFVK
jgi:hypothetical protein